MTTNSLLKRNLNRRSSAMADEAYDDDDEFNESDEDEDEELDESGDDEPATGDSATFTVHSSSTAAAGASSSATPATGKRRRGGRKAQSYAPSLRDMMYGFGDVRTPDDDTVAVLEEVAVEYMTEMTRKAIKVNGRPGKVETQDIVFLIRRDAKKVDRVRELIRMRQQLQEMRKLTDVSGGAPN